VTRHTPLWVKLPVWLIAVTIIVASVTGFIALGRFVAHQVVLTGLVAGVAGVGYLAIRAMTRGRTGAESIVGTGLARFGLEDTRRRQISRLIEVMATFGLLLLTLPVLLVQWGFSGDDIRDWSKALLFGFEVGQFRISLVRILIGILLFTGLLFATRLFQRWLRDQVLTQPRVDVGIANSVDTAVGYAGTGLALLLAVSYAGFDVTSLAIFASALAVGVGFGLQSIVNNFVSGLILLVERPIKVGDWIVVGGEQGNVRRISVRSTEIETFDRASLIVPNAELISGRVLNWTHRNSLGRTMLKITLDADVDPERVINILQSCAEAHPDVLKTPKPSVTFDNFSSTALEFTIRVTLADVYRGGGVATELRIAILRILKEQGLIKIATSPDAA
jgi:small-conductance mechanosensitive channel